METAAGSQLKLVKSKIIGLYQRTRTRTKHRREYGTEFNEPGLDFEQLSTDLRCWKERKIFDFKLQAGTPALLIKSLFFAVPDAC